MTALEALADFSHKFLECTLTMRFQPHPAGSTLITQGQPNTYYVLEILYPKPDKSWGILKSGSFNLDVAAKDLFEAWNLLQHEQANGC